MVDIMPRLERPETPRLSARVFEVLVEAFREGRLDEGEILRDSELAARLGVSRMPVREELLRLERIGLIDVEPSRFTRVTHVTEKLAQESLAFAGYTGGMLLRMLLPDLSPADHATLRMRVRALAVAADVAALAFALEELLSFLIGIDPRQFAADARRHGAGRGPERLGAPSAARGARRPRRGRGSARRGRGP